MKRALLLPLLLLCAQTLAPPTLEQLYDALRTAPDEDSADHVEERIRVFWLNQASPATALLFSRGERETEAKSLRDAIDDFTAVLDLQPDFAEAYSQRGQARFSDGDYQGALEDLAASLRLDPRHFDSLDALSRIAESRGDWKGAYAAWQKLMEIDPHMPGGKDRLSDLQRRALGDNT